MHFYTEHNVENVVESCKNMCRTHHFTVISMENFLIHVFFLIRTNFIRTMRLKLLKLREQIKNILRLESSKIKIQDNNNLYFLKKLIPE